MNEAPPSPDTVSDRDSRGGILGSPSSSEELGNDEMEAAGELKEVLMEKRMEDVVTEESEERIRQETRPSIPRPDWFGPGSLPPF
jgi:hypothetical protein